MNKIKGLTAIIVFMISLSAFAQNPFSMEASGPCVNCSIAPGLQEQSSDKLTQSHEELDLSRVFLDKNGKDPRKEVEPVGPYGTIGRIVSDDGNRSETATAFLVSPCHILTAGHAVLRKDVKQTDLVHTFYYGQKLAGSTKARLVDHGNYDRVKSPAVDWALLVLDGCVGAPKGRADIGGKGIGWMEIPDSLQYDQTIKVNLAGFSMDQQNSEEFNQLFLDQNCELKRFDRRFALWFHDCASTEGTSGGPIFGIVDGVPQVYGINVAALTHSGADTIERHYDEKYANVAVNLFTFIGQDSFHMALESDPRISSFIGQNANPLRRLNPSAIGM